MTTNQPSAARFATRSELETATKREFYYIENSLLSSGVHYLEAMRLAVERACAVTGMSPGDLEFSLGRKFL